MIATSTSQKGFTLVELIISTIIAALLLAAMNGVISQALDANNATQLRNDSIQTTHFAMQRMVRAISRSQRLLLPLKDKPLTPYPDNIREQTIPASPPPPGSVFASAVVAVTQDTSIDLDGDSIPDADNDGDGRFDEDLPADMTYDLDPGIKGIDDDGDGFFDEGIFANADDDEGGVANEDFFDDVDNDGDNNVDEDAGADMNGDNEPGIAGVDDDNDGQVDEGSNQDDDEDGQSNEDWIDPVVFYLQGSTLIERIPVPWDESGGGLISGLDYIEAPIAENVTRFRVERIPQGSDRDILVDLTLEITPPDGEMFNLNTRVRVGGAL